MSDDELEISESAGPAPQVRQARNTNHNTQLAKAGPSSKVSEGVSKQRAQGRPAKRSRISPSPVSKPDVERINVDSDEEEPGEEARDEDDDEVATLVQPPPPPINGQGRRPVSKKSAKDTTIERQTNGVGKGKGKAKAASTTVNHNTATRRPRTEGATDGDDDDVEAIHGPAPSVARAINSGSNPRAKNRTNVQAELERLRKHNEELQAYIQALQKQVDEAFTIRTEAEQLFEYREKKMEAQIEEQEHLISRLTAVAESKEPLLRTGRTSILHLIPQDEADDRARTAETEMKRWKEIAEDRQIAVREHVKRIQELESVEKELQAELKAEIDRANTMAKAAKNQPSMQRGYTAVAVDDPKQTQLIKFYEDLTNLLITGLKFQKVSQDPGEKECWVFQCIYSHPQEDASGDYIKDLNFTLRLEPETPGSDETPVVHYLPLQLDKEKPELVAKLAFLSAPFTFPRHQLALFLRTLHDNVKGTDEGSEEMDGMDEVPMVTS